MNKINPFHVAFPVDDLEKSRHFYGNILGCSEGRSSETWIDFNLFGHQIVAHLKPLSPGASSQIHNPVDGHDVPVPHFGVVLDMENWHSFAKKLKASDVNFVIEPYVRFKGQIGEQATMFFLDPSGNALEFKAFADPEQLFAR